MALQIHNTGATVAIVVALNNLEILPSATATAPFYVPYTQKQVVAAIAGYPTITMTVMPNGSFEVSNSSLLQTITIVDLGNLVVAPSTTVAVPVSAVAYTEAQILNAVAANPALVISGAVPALSVEVPTEADQFNPLVFEHTIQEINEVVSTCVIKNGYNDTFVTAGGKTVTVVDGQIVSII